MILIIHQRASKVIKVLKGKEQISFSHTSPSLAFWDLAEKFPEEIIAWCEEEICQDLNIDLIPEIFDQDRIMASFSVNTNFLPDTIGYIDQLPFVNINREVLYATWRMSTDVGGIKGRTLLMFKRLFGNIKDFGFLLDSIAKLGQQNGLFCYSSPQLFKTDPSIPDTNQKPKNTAGIVHTFSFVNAHYKTFRLFLLFWCYMKYERSFPVLAFIRALFQKKYFKKNIDLSSVTLSSRGKEKQEKTVDVIIPTLGRRNYLLQVLEDLKAQSLLPKKVIIVEQNPEPGSRTELPELETKTWPFEIIHHFTHQTGACNARNLALKEVDADWVFLADDDIRLDKDLLENGLIESSRLGVDCLNINCKQEGQETVFHKIKQWGSFGSGTSIVKAKYCMRIRFDEVFEYGFGEDQDYGMQMRNAGCDIIYHPELQILHLKAPRGGFREMSTAPWEMDKPKPSPTLMVFAKKHYSPEQLKGFKTELFCRYYSKQEIKNPIKYLISMNERWRRSNEWAEKLISGKEKQVLKTEMNNEI